MSDPIPKYYEFFNPVLDAVGRLGGSATIDEIVEEVVEAMELPSEVVDAPHGDSASWSSGSPQGWCQWSRSTKHGSTRSETGPRFPSSVGCWIRARRAPAGTAPRIRTHHPAR